MSFTFDVIVDITSTATDPQYDVNDIVEGAFDTQDDQNTFLARLRDTGDSAFDSVSSVSVNAPGTPANTPSPTTPPTTSPTQSPTQLPTISATEHPTAGPTQPPTMPPSQPPTMLPTLSPTQSPTNNTDGRIDGDGTDGLTDENTPGEKNNGTDKEFDEANGPLTEEQPRTGSSNPTGMIVGVTAGVVVGAACLFLIGFLVAFRNRNQKESPSSSANQISPHNDGEYLCEIIVGGSRGEEISTLGDTASFSAHGQRYGTSSIPGKLIFTYHDCYTHVVVCSSNGGSGDEFPCSVRRITPEEAECVTTQWPFC